MTVSQVQQGQLSVIPWSTLPGHRRNVTLKDDFRGLTADYVDPILRQVSRME